MKTEPLAMLWEHKIRFTYVLLHTQAQVTRVNA